MQAGELFTFSLEDDSPPAPLPAHVLEAQQGDVDAQLGPALPDAAHVARAHPGNQGHWEKREERKGKMCKSCSTEEMNSRTGIALSWECHLREGEILILFSFKNKQLRAKPA